MSKQRGRRVALAASRRAGVDAHITAHDLCGETEREKKVMGTRGLLLPLILIAAVLTDTVAKKVRRIVKCNISLEKHDIRPQQKFEKFSSPLSNVYFLLKC